MRQVVRPRRPGKWARGGATPLLDQIGIVLLILFSAAWLVVLLILG
ncbi:conserved hypothetical protein [Gluconacetobacter diazotrophicus PA1 5]|uniref:Uncharacterized protein n=2 Tax=Gluconacetobacter diazotrophicus TaxID=33996 RepID=A0A7W4NKB7_GLUDI|nr:hypothetical protein [Gluconacetobacter diazotrophicus]ACI52270.1 conserved hypothetical protein [Gluconacetobacter diazotrophicus PA1 5]MBB2156823.1 hypothetical protein [Gluconacetobacter diazotrophicus]TWB04835.1 hypothetical protein FBZ86_11957 [Gluconacetobacter diazotrophicus]CAP57584.1 putative membrane protein [Gluconacetobacter diazotrophicus PA1 5]